MSEITFREAVEAFAYGLVRGQGHSNKIGLTLQHIILKYPPRTIEKLNFESVEKPRLKKDWEGRYVRLLKEIETRGGIILDVGEVMEVMRNFGGLNLSAVTQCENCNKHTRRYVTKVPEWNVELLPIDYKPQEQS